MQNGPPTYMLSCLCLGPQVQPGSHFLHKAFQFQLPYQKIRCCEFRQCILTGALMGCCSVCLVYRQAQCVTSGLDWIWFCLERQEWTDCTTHNITQSPPEGACPELEKQEHRLWSLSCSQIQALRFTYVDMLASSTDLPHPAKTGRCGRENTWTG